MEYERDNLVSQAQEIERVIKDNQTYGPDSIFLAYKDKCFEHVTGK
jgi:hypothetical protein